MEKGTLTVRLAEYLDPALAKFTFTPEEEKKIEEKIKALEADGKPRVQAVSEAVACCAPEKAALVKTVGTFTADKIKIKGGDYRWRDDGDGYFTVLDVPIISEWKKGSHGATYDGTKEVLEEYVATAQKRYQEGHFCATAYKRHNPDIPIDHPDFLGYALPNRVGKYTLESGDKWTVFGDVKLSAAAFADAKAGKIPYISAEVPWAKRRIRGVSFQDTLPPEYEYALFTVGEEVKDSAGKFDVSKDSVAKFMDDESAKSEKKEGAPHKEPDGDECPTCGEMGCHIAKHIAGQVGEHVKKYLQSAGQYSAPPFKPTPLPSEPVKVEGGANMVEPEMAAKFTAQANEIAELKGRLDKQDCEKRAQAMVARAEKAYEGKIITPAHREQIAQFAADWSALKDGEERFTKYVEALKPSLKDKPTTSAVGAMTAGGSIDASNPVVAKFANQGPDAMEAAGRFSAQWRELKRVSGDRFSCPEEDFVKNEMIQLAARAASQNGKGE